MTITDIQNKVADRLNLTSTQALARIIDSANIGYRKAASSCGINLIEHVIGVSAITVIGNRSLTFSSATTTPATNVQKILAVYNTNFTPPMVLGEETFDTLRQEVIVTDPPTLYAIQSATSNSVTIFLNTTPSSNFTLTIDCMANLATLSGTQVPAIPEDFHDLLVAYAMAIELQKMEKYELASAQMSGNPDKPGIYEQRLSDLRYYYAVSAYKDIYQGKNETILASSRQSMV